MRRTIWSEDVHEWACQDARPWSQPADALTWALLCVGPLVAAGIVALVLRVWR